MALYKVLKKFRDKYTREVYKEGQVVEMTVKRADEAMKNLKKFEGEFLERIDNKEEENIADTKEEQGEDE